jgi:hypothetical protein
MWVAVDILRRDCQRSRVGLTRTSGILRMVPGRTRSNPTGSELRVLCGIVALLAAGSAADYVSREGRIGVLV